MDVQILRDLQRESGLQVGWVATARVNRPRKKPVDVGDHVVTGSGLAIASMECIEFESIESICLRFSWFP